MPNTFQLVDIYLADAHLTIDSLTNPAILNDRFRFLADATRYGIKAFGGKVVNTDVGHKEVQTTDLVVSRVPKKLLGWSHFWAAFHSIAKSEAELWNLQFPFIGHLEDLNIEWANAQSLHVQIHPKIFLTAVGWSTRLHLSISGNMTSARVREVVDSTKHGRQFLVDGENLDLSQLFKLIGDRIHKELYPKKGVSRHDILRIQRQCFIAIRRYFGPKQYFSAAPAHGIDVMDDADKALVFSMLYGQEIGIADLPNAKHVLSVFQHSNFAVTEFEKGTFLFPQELAHNTRTSAQRRECACLVADLSSFIPIAFLLASFVTYSESSESQVVRALGLSVKKVLRAVAEKYDNALTRNLMMKHPLLRDVGRRTDTN